MKSKIEELEKSISYHKTALYDERQNYLRLVRENGEFKRRQVEDERKIQELLDVYEGGETGKVYCKDVKLEVGNTFINNDVNYGLFSLISTRGRMVQEHLLQIESRVPTQLTPQPWPIQPNRRNPPNPPPTSSSLLNPLNLLSLSPIKSRSNSSRSSMTTRWAISMIKTNV